MGRKTFLLVALAAIVAGATYFFFAQRTGGVRAARRGFVSTNGARFIIDGQPFRFTGANVSVMYRDEDRERMPETMKEAARDGLRVVRVWAFGEGGEDGITAVGNDKNDWPRKHRFRPAPDRWNEDEFAHLDRVIAEAARNNLRVQLCLTNWWRDTGGITQYLYWAGIKDAADDRQPFGINMERAMLFYTNEVTRRLYREHVEKIVTRRNTVTGVLYRDDPTIMGYELMNEAQAPTGRWSERRAWVAEMSAYIKSLDPDHLIAPGTWGYRTSWERREWLEEHRIPTIDYCDVHNYPRDDHDSFVDSPEALRAFLDNRAAAAFSLNKPFLVGEFGMGPEGYQGFSEVDWYRAFFESSMQAGAGGAMFWIVTPDPHRGYGITYTTPRDETVRAEIRRASELFAAHQGDAPPNYLLDASRHLVPRQFSFTRSPSDPMTRPEIIMPEKEGGAILYRFTPEMAVSARFEKMGGGMGYIWGSGVGQVEYLLPARDKGRWVKSVVVRAHVQPVLPVDAHPPVVATRVTLLINGMDCGSRLVPVEDAKQAIVEEWVVDSMRVRMLAGRGLPLSIRFAVKVDADAPFGLNISNFAETHNRPNAKPIEIEVR
ncbi:MAG: mannan endo,4-beta-mannosidase [Acidobacteriota bacterium]|jgi:mannan endo-1,4-beta-mannosidase|nr:mannan endo,4-beta-mannosidase [Acidobacteriota bacterium]